MLVIRALGWSVAALLTSAAWVGPPSSEVEELEALEQQIARAWVDGDRDRLVRVLADDWTVIDISGRVRTKSAILDEMFGTQGSVIATMNVDDVHVRLLGDVGVVTGRTLAVGKDGTTMRLRFTDVAVRGDGGWRIVASQGTPIVE